MSIKIITDSGCDLSLDYVKENNIEVVPLMVNINGKFIPDDLGQTLSRQDFYDLLKDGILPTTTQVNIGSFYEVFKTYIEKGDEIVYIGLSSALSGTYNSAVKAKEMLLEEYSNAKIYTIDSLSASLGEGLLVYTLKELLDKGTPLLEAIKFIEENKRKVIHSIIVDDLNHLKRGGRLSGAAAAVGSILNIKPVLKVDDEGKAVVADKVKGRKRAIKYLFNDYNERGVNKKEQVVFIMNAAVKEDAELLKNMIETESVAKKVIIYDIGCVIGSHTGPGTLAVVYFGDKR
ncbi:MAG: DegV family protein [Clostridiales bacterium]|nr:DegV family protein [Clostridiales bacterium]